MTTLSENETETKVVDFASNDNTRDDAEDNTQDSENSALFKDISPDNVFTELESLCMACEQQGVTRLLLTKIPFFKEIVIMAFSCPHCGYRSNEVQSAGQVQDKGQRIELRVGSRKDLNRQVVKSEFATITIPELEFEIPASSQRGQMKTIEGFLRQTIDALAPDQAERQKVDPESAAKIQAFLDRLENCAQGNEVFHFIVDDPSGNSFVENPFLPLRDPDMKVSHYSRTAEQSALLGLTHDESVGDMALKDLAQMTMTGRADEATPGSAQQAGADEEPDEEGFNYKSEVMDFPGNCSACHAPVMTHMKIVDIPYFKEVVIMAVSCDSCGYKSNDVKAGGAIPAKGVRLTLKVSLPEDMSRSVLSSTTARLYIPERDIEFSTSTSGGRFTTLEGLLDDIVANVRQYPFLMGDSSRSETHRQVDEFEAKVNELKSGKVPFTFVLEDPAGNSYIQNIHAPEPDPTLTSEEFERSFEQNEELGLNDINVADDHTPNSVFVSEGS
eukprot:TRINITY_DN9065_c0_g1_i1.p1 TRINITY_DN9065_c0_g1~~TRINITY_DN9065_c0_g1_i1.p1  ORF type:complete len:501 (+),score=182.92 TRINITY_DN9065_c0_g1_i1:120-1622(+)